MNKLIYIVEDDENVRELIKKTLTSFSYETRVFDNAESALKAIAKRIPDAILFDVMLPGISGVDATKMLRVDLATTELPIILITAKDNEIDRIIGLDSGADDYITKPFGVLELGARVRAVLRRVTPVCKDKFANQEIKTLDFSIDTKTREVRKNNELLDLTFKEYELFLHLIREKSRFVPRSELLMEIWGGELEPESRTLDIHIKKLRQKIGDNAENPKYIKTSRSVGHRFIGETV